MCLLNNTQPSLDADSRKRKKKIAVKTAISHPAREIQTARLIVEV
jgi:hypothetical protein